MEYLVELSFVEWLPGGSLRLVEKLVEVAAKIIEVLPTGYSITDIWVERKKLKVVVNEPSASLGSAIDSVANDGSIYVEEGDFPAQALPLPVIVAIIAAIVTAIWPVLVLIGVVIIAWKVIELFQQKEITRQIIEKSDLIEKATEAGLTPDQINDMLRGVEKERISDVLKWVSIIGGVTIVGVGAIIAFKELRKVEA